MTSKFKRGMKKIFMFVILIALVGCAEQYALNDEKPILTPGVMDVTVSEQITAQAVKQFYVIFAGDL